MTTEQHRLLLLTVTLPGDAKRKVAARPSLLSPLTPNQTRSINWPRNENLSGMRRSGWPERTDLSILRAQVYTCHRMGAPTCDRSDHTYRRLVVCDPEQIGS